MSTHIVDLRCFVSNPVPPKCSPDGSTWLRFNAGLKEQGLRKDYIPVRSRWQPFSAWYGLIAAVFTSVFCGWQLFAPGAFVVADFIFAYAAFFITIALFLIWKVKTVWKGEQAWSWIAAGDMDFVTGVEEIEEMCAADEAERAGAGKTWPARVYARVF